MKNEVWKAVVGFEGRYEVSDRGRVRSVARIDNLGHRRGGHMMKLRVCPVHGYVTVKLCGGFGRRRLCKVHRLVLEAFAPRPSSDLQVCHDDGCKQNNCLNNLYWGTSKQNHKDKQRHGTIARGELNGGGGKLCQGKVALIKRKLTAGEPKKSIAREFGVSDTMIRLIATDRVWRHVEG